LVLLRVDLVIWSRLHCLMLVDRGRLRLRTSDFRGSDAIEDLRCVGHYWAERSCEASEDKESALATMKLG
jgi:hypothetical protein